MPGFRVLSTRWCVGGGEDGFEWQFLGESVSPCGLHVLLQSLRSHTALARSTLPWSTAMYSTYVGGQHVLARVPCVVGEAKQCPASHVTSSCVRPQASSRHCRAGWGRAAAMVGLGACCVLRGWLGDGGRRQWWLLSTKSQGLVMAQRGEGPCFRRGREAWRRLRG